MAIRRLNAKELERIVARYQAQLEAANGDIVKVVARIARELEQDFVIAVGKGSIQATPEGLDTLRRALRQIVADSVPEASEALGEGIPRVAGLSLQRSAATTSWMAGGSLRTAQAGRLVETFLRWERSIRSREVLRTTAAYQNRWARAWNQTWEREARKLQNEFVKAALAGDTNKQIAKRIAAGLDLLKAPGPSGPISIRGHIPSDRFADAFVRTKYNELYNDFGIAVATDAGLDMFVNIGIPDDRQSDECFEASQMDPMSLDEWQATEVGLPPRHVLNCRCTMVAVLPEQETQNWKQPNPKFEKVAA